jgi:hypothetical protein
MPSSAPLQLIARGRQDVYLTGDPQMTFFKQVYRRYTPFAIESIPIEFDGNTDFGRRISCTIPRKADLLWQMFIEIELPPLPQPDVSGSPNLWVNDIAHALIEDISIEIGDKEIDKHTGRWLNIWGELTTPAEKRDGYNAMVGHVATYPAGAPDPTKPLRLTLPLRFWFNENIGEALPLISLQAHPVRLILHLRPFQELWWNQDAFCPPPVGPCPTLEPVAITRFQLFGDYVFLDTDERRKFAAAKHEYLINQLQIVPPQSVPAGAASANIPLFLNHACKEFIWVVQQERMAAAHEWFNYGNLNECDTTGTPDDLLASAIIRLDGYDRFHRRNALYFRLTQPYQYHTNIPDNYIYLYSFSLHPESEQPSGSLNASKINDIQLSLAFNTTLLSEPRMVHVWATNYNVLRIVGGLGGLAFIA